MKVLRPNQDYAIYLPAGSATNPGINSPATFYGAVNVNAIGARAFAACGTIGRSVSFEVGGRLMRTTASWDNTQVTRLDLQAGRARLFLPLLMR